MKPLCIDVFCGLGGWTEGFLAEGWECIGFDIERHDYGSGGYPAQLVLQDALTIHGKQFRQADCLVMSPPCQEYSYMAMPWSKAKAKERDLLEGRDDPKRLTALFDACFRIQREAIEAAGHFIPLVVENVRGAQKWVGQCNAHFGSYYLWGDVPALMPYRLGYHATAASSIAPSIGNTHSIASVCQSITGPSIHTQAQGVKHRGSGPVWFDTGPASMGSKSRARKAASAAIAKIPLPLARHIAHYWRPAA